jgi:small subunit ribosomal protein S4
MARYTGPVCKLCRREGEKLYLKGDRCYSKKCAFEQRSYPPGQHGRRAQFRRKVSDYALQLRAKQRARRIYGVLERQFRRYFRMAERQPGMTGPNLLVILERRLDNVVYRMGFADSRSQARQLVLHGHFDLNGHRANVPSMLVKTGDTITVRERSRRLTYFSGMAERLGQATTVDWLTLDPQGLAGQVNALPTREQIDVPLTEQLIVEYYSAR